MQTPVIAVVDNNPTHRSLINFYLVVNKFLEVHTFLSHDECLYRLHKNLRPDFLITDLPPAGHDVFEFLRLVKSDSPATKVIFFDAFDNQEMATLMHQAGATDYIRKLNKPDLGISELIKNIRFLQKEKSFS
ncbi:MAG: response regulator [Bacteroidota bacterium]